MTSRQYASVIVLLATAATIAVTRPVCAQPLPISIAQYDKDLSAVQSDAVDAASGNASAQAAAVKALGDIGLVPIRMPGDQIVFADNRPIIAQIQAAQNSADDADARLIWTQTAAEVQSIRSAFPLTTTNLTSSDAAAASARALLSTSEFASEPIVPNSIGDKIGDSIARFLRELGKLFHPRGANPGPLHISPLVPEVLLIIILTTAISLIVYFVYTTTRTRFGASRHAASSSMSALALTSEERDLVSTYNYARLRELADEAALRRDYRSAFRLTFLATLVVLSLEGAIKLDRSKTNWEYLRSLAEHKEVRDQLRPRVRDFDRIWYGLQDAEIADYSNAVTTYESVRLIIGDESKQDEASVNGQTLAKASR